MDLRAQLQSFRDFIGYIVSQPFWTVLSVLLTLVIFGTAGYMLLEGWSLLDSFYMTVITMATIGYGEVNQLSPNGRLFTIGLIVIGVIGASYAVTATVELFSSKEFLGPIRHRRRLKTLKKISNHCVICGFGRMGRSLAWELRARDSAVIIIDQDDNALEEARQLEIPAVPVNASDENILQEAGLERAASLVTATASDAQNVFIILTARSLNPDLHIITRCNKESSIPKLEKAGADSVISPYAIAGRRTAHMLTHPNVTNFLDGVLDFGDHKMRLEEFVIEKKSPLAGLALRDAKLKVAVLAVDHPEKTVFVHPNANTILMPDSAIIVMGIDQELNKLEQLVQG